MYITYPSAIATQLKTRGPTHALQPGTKETWHMKLCVKATLAGGLQAHTEVSILQKQVD